MRRYCPEIFDALIDIADKKDKSVTDIEDSGILPGVRFYSDILKPEGTPGDREQQGAKRNKDCHGRYVS